MLFFLCYFFYLTFKYMISPFQASQIAKFALEPTIVYPIQSLVLSIFEGDADIILSRKLVRKTVGLLIGWIVYVLVITRFLKNVTLPLIPKWADSGVEDVIKMGSVLFVAKLVMISLNDVEKFNKEWKIEYGLTLLGFFIANVIVFKYIEISLKYKPSKVMQYSIKFVIAYIFVQLIKHKMDYFSTGKYKGCIALMIGLIVSNHVSEKIMN
jgi:hypothetical protein